MTQTLPKSTKHRQRKNLGPMYEICMTSGIGCDPDADWLKQMKENHLCSYCRGLLVTSGPIDAVVAYVPKPSRLGQSLVNHVGIAVIHRDIIDLLGHDDVAANLWIGRVFKSNGRELTHLATYRGKEVIFVRGENDSNNRFRPLWTCPVCHDLIHTPYGKRHIISTSITGRSIYEGDITQLVINETVRKRLGDRKWYGTGIHKLPIYDEPIDGLPPLPNILREQADG